jgi:REP element-mobilizing transposase RayT
MFEERTMTSSRRQRLPLDAYRVEGSVWHTSISVVKQHGRVFDNIAFGEETLMTFMRACDDGRGIPHLICIMPDHLHFLVEVCSEGLVELVGRAKSMTTRVWWRHGGSGTFWQRSFHDHGIRGSEDYEPTVTYLLHNPVRAGMVEQWEDYPLIGGTLIVGD